MVSPTRRLSPNATACHRHGVPEDSSIHANTAARVGGSSLGTEPALAGPLTMASPSEHHLVDPATCDLITYLAASVGVSEVEALDRLGDCLLEHSDGLRSWAGSGLQVFSSTPPEYCASAR